MRVSPIIAGAVVGCLSVAVGSEFVFGRAPAPAAPVEAVPAPVPGPMRAFTAEAVVEETPAPVAAAPRAPEPKAKARAARLAQAGAAAGPLALRGHLRGADAAHKSRGTVDLVATERGIQARLSDFATAPGAGLEVWLVSHPDPKKPADVTKARTLSLGALRSLKGDQIYTLPDGADPGPFKSLVIWSKQLNAPVATAPLKGRG